MVTQPTSVVREARLILGCQHCQVPFDMTWTR